MPIDISPGTPGRTLHRLAKKLLARQKRLKPIYDRYEGNAPLPDSMKLAPDSAKVMFKAARTGFAELVVRSVKYSLNIQSIGTAVTSTDLGDETAHDMFVDSGMAEESDDVHRNCLIAGDAYGMLGNVDDGVAFTAEDPRQVVSFHDPVRQRVMRSAAKFWHDDDLELDIAHMWTVEQRELFDGEGRVYLDEPRVILRRATVARKTPTRSFLRFSPTVWDWDPEYGGVDGVVVPDVGDEIPVYRYRDEEGVGEFERHVDILNRLDHMVLQGLVIATLQAFKQRAIKVSPDDMPDEDEDGNAIDYTDVFSADPGALWKLPQSAEIWESAPLDLTPVWTGVDKFTQQFSAVTFTPLAVFSQDGQNNTAKGVEFARETRTLKVKDRQRRFGTVHARALAAMFRISGDPDRAVASKIEVQWGPAEIFSLAERHDAAVKAKTSGVPWRTRMIDILQYTPKQVARMEVERLDDEFVAALTAPADDQPAPAPETSGA